MSASEPSDAWPEWLICTLDGIGPSGARGFLVGDGDWPFRGFIVRAGDELYAYANICPHRRHPLDMLPDQFLVDDGRLIRCGSHGALFTPETGECVFGPCVGDQLMSLPLRVDERGGIYVRAPDNLQVALVMEPGEEGFSGTN